MIFKIYTYIILVCFISLIAWKHILLAKYGLSSAENKAIPKGTRGGYVIAYEILALMWIMSYALRDMPLIWSVPLIIVLVMNVKLLSTLIHLTVMSNAAVKAGLPPLDMSKKGKEQQ